jgi:hypothetical protein
MKGPRAGERKPVRRYNAGGQKTGKNRGFSPTKGPRTDDRSADPERPVQPRQRARPAAGPGGDGGCRHRQRGGSSDRGRAQGLVPHLRHEHHHGPRPAGRAGRAQALAAAHPGGDERPEPPARAQAPQVRQDLRRHLGQLPPTRRVGDLPHAGGHGPALEDVGGAGRLAGQLRLDRRRPARGDALHRGPHGPRGGGHARGHQARHRRLPAQRRPSCRASSRTC